MKERIKGAFTKKKIFHFLKMALFVVALSLNNICILTYGHDVVQPDTFYYLCNVFTYQFSTFHDTEL